MPKVYQLLQNRWSEELAREGLAPVLAKPPANEAAQRGGVTCPACGTTAPLVDGACSDCGLFLG